MYEYKILYVKTNKLTTINTSSIFKVLDKISQIESTFHRQTIYSCRRRITEISFYFGGKKWTISNY